MRCKPCRANLFSEKQTTLCDHVPAAGAAVATGRIGLHHRDRAEPVVLGDDGKVSPWWRLPPKLLVPLRRRDAERFEAARAGDDLSHRPPLIGLGSPSETGPDEVRCLRPLALEPLAGFKQDIFKPDALQRDQINGFAVARDLNETFESRACRI